MSGRRLILLGGGHAHVHVLARAARRPLAGVDVLLMSAEARQHYSGMVPGFLRGAYEESDLAIDLEALAARAGARFLRATADRIDLRSGRVVAGGESFGFDLLSLDVGSAPAGLDVPGVRDHAFTVRPLSRVVALRRRARELFSGSLEPVRVAVVGGGAAGVEVALALEELGRSIGPPPVVTLFEGAPRLLPELAERPRQLARRALEKRGIRVRTGRFVTSLEPGTIRLDDGEVAATDLTVWLAGAAPPALLGASELPKDDRGFLLVDGSLRVVDGSPVFGAGDCIGIRGVPQLPKAGVYAVREAPILDANLRAALGGGRLRTFRPQKTFLALLNTADGRAIWRWKNLAGHSRAAWRLKDWIDRRFVGRYREAT